MQFSHAYFINGTAYAGKSTMVKLLAEKHGGIACGENYQDTLLPGLSPAEFPCLTYTRDLQDWRDFIRRSPEAYKAWFDGCIRECTILEMRILKELEQQDRMIFVDTNIPPEVLHQVAPDGHVVIMLADPEISVRCFFERPDREKQFLYQLLMAEPDPDSAMANFRAGLMKINSPENYQAFLNAGFPVVLRDEKRTVEETLAIVEGYFYLQG